MWVARKTGSSYCIYKDRFLLSLSVSLVLHSIVVAIILLLSPRSEKQALRPLSLGVLNSSNMPAKKRSVVEKHAKIKDKEDVLQKPKKQQETPLNRSDKEALSESNDVSLDFDINSIVVGEERFDPFKTHEPSITQAMRDSSQAYDEMPSVIQENIQKLYGNAYHKLSKVEKDYIARTYFLNAEILQRQADRMGYPDIAARLGQTGQPIIEFTLHPDGHVDNVVYIRKSEFESIDNSIKSVVEIGAKDLARPPSPVRIRVQGNYFIK